ncbi:MAG TPA: POTRA domain-containing protein, partial [Bacteroidota bacterium]|nr:POTRA domain-containing protein [Bacteroidota bacterium]
MRYLLLLILPVSVVLIQTLYAQTPVKEVYKILGVSVEFASSKTASEPAGIIAHSGLKVGDEIAVPGDQVRQAIQRLWALRIFSDVQILIENKVENGVYLLIKVAEYPRFDRAVFEGRDDVDEDDLMKKVSVVKGQILTPDYVIRIVNDIRHLYEEEGHLLATITPSTSVDDSSKGNSVVLTLKIDEGPSVTIDKVHVTGCTAFSEDDVKDHLDETKEKTWWQFWSHPKFDRKKFDTDKQSVLKFYRKNGYIDAEVVSDTTWYSADKEKINVSLAVHEGAQYKIRNIVWDGNTIYKSDALGERLQIAPGDVYNEEKFDQNLRGNADQSDVASLYLDNGYLQFRLDPEIVRVPCDSAIGALAGAESVKAPPTTAACDSLDIIVHVYERNQFRVRQVDIVGNTKTHDDVIRRELYTRPGDFFSRASIIRSLRQLQQLNYFNPEKLKPEPRMVDEENVDLVYEVEEKSSDNVNASIGY